MSALFLPRDLLAALVHEGEGAEVGNRVRMGVGMRYAALWETDSGESSQLYSRV